MAAIIDMENAADECAAWAAHAPLTEGVLTPFGVLDPAALSQSGKIDALVGLERLIGWAQAQQDQILAAAAARPEPVPAPERAQEHRALLSLTYEVACALRWSPGLTAGRIGQARTLVARFPATLALLEDGRITHPHVRALLDGVRGLEEATAGKVETRVLARAGTQTPAEFRRAVRGP